MISKIVLMKGTRNYWIGELDIPPDTTTLIEDFKGLVRNNVFDYCKTTKQGRVYRERIKNHSSTIIPIQSMQI